MTPLLVNKEDDDEAMERMSREIPFFPQPVAHKLFGKESEFSMYKRSTSYTGAFDAALDPLNLPSPSCVKSGMAIDLSLKLHYNQRA